MSRRSSTDSDDRSDADAAVGRVLHLDAFSGIAGNMFLAALLDAGLSQEQLEGDLAALPLDFKLRVSAVQRGGVAGRYLEVAVPGAAHDPGPTHPHPDPAHGPDPTHDHEGHDHEGHDHEGHDHEDREWHVDVHSSGDPTHGRTFGEIRTLLEDAPLEASVRARALAIFEALGHAEARVHGVALEDVHFHEVGAVDAIVDITGAAIGLQRLGIERVTCTPLALGHGFVDSAHGRLPLPAPATLELLRGIPTVPAHVEWETVTPTGAAIARCIVDEFRPLPAMVVERVGYGAGRDRQGPMPNLLRAVLGSAGGSSSDRIVVLETHLDDLVPEHFDYVMERLFEAGALDVSLHHIQMKKNRPGFAVRVLARPSERQALAQLLVGETTAIGVRFSEWDRLVLERDHHRVETPWGEIGVKRVRGVDGRYEVSAEYDDCKRAARASGTPLRDVVREVERIAREQLT